MNPLYNNKVEFSLNCRGKLIGLKNPIIMGILNITPDSFSDGGLYKTEKLALEHAELMINEGAKIVDIGAQSTNPKAKLITAKEERKRLGRVISKLRSEFPDILISLDSFYPNNIEFGADEGIDIINDISGGQYDEKMFETVAKTELSYILMHVNETYENMHHKNNFENIIVSINQYFSKKVRELTELRVHDIILDPGFGFGKTFYDQYQMTDNFEYFNLFDLPLLAGISRKSFIYKTLNKNPLEIIEETQKLHLELLKKGAKILRVHDVGETKKTIDLFLKNEN